MTEKERVTKERIKLQKRFGEHLRKVRSSKNISGSELARRCFMEKSTIARLEAGGRTPSLYILVKLCEGLGIELKELFKDFQP
jgi:transcriptional regulator with XRE-family HTH domain